MFSGKFTRQKCFSYLLCEFARYALLTVAMLDFAYRQVFQIQLVCVEGVEVQMGVEPFREDTLWSQLEYDYVMQLRLLLLNMNSLQD